MLPAGVTVRLTSSLMVIAQDEIDIQGTLTVSATPAPPRTPVNITLVTAQGDVKVGGVVGQSPFFPVQAPAGNSPVVVAASAIARGQPGVNAGYVRILSPLGSVDIQGTVMAISGGNGGSADATGLRVGRQDGWASAAGAGGGYGGDVRICAMEGISVGPSGIVGAGHGGGGGLADAVAVNRQKAWAVAGESNSGGTVFLEGYAPRTPAQLVNQGRIQGGLVTYGNEARATGGPGGGEAEAEGGDAGDGGTVLFQGIVTPSVGIINAAAGGGGGKAVARGGAGARPGPFIGSNGNAKARGGDGGSSGAIPVIPLPNGTTIPGGLAVPAGIPGLFAYGKGGNADALAGNGAPNRNSGSEDALGGTGASGTAPAPATAGPVAPAGPGVGGVAAGSLSLGTP